MPQLSTPEKGADPKVLIFYDRPEDLPDLQKRFPNVRFSTCVRYDDLPIALAEISPDIAFACKFEPKPFPREHFVNHPTLRWLSIGFAGIDHVVPWDEDRLTVTNASGVAAEEMAQYALGAIFGLYQRFPFFAKRQAEKHWDYQLIRSARGAKIGLVGLGHTGKAIAQICKSVGLSVVACRSTGASDACVEKVYPASELNQMLREVDVTIVCAALTPATRDMFDSNAFATMRAGSFFINLSRGSVVVEKALIDALSSGHLAGAVIDVTRTEPLPPSDPLWEAPNLLITPHTSSEFINWQAKAAEMFADNLDRWLAGRELHNRVYSKRGY